jgi:hypothetical protein
MDAGQGAWASVTSGPTLSEVMGGRGVVVSSVMLTRVDVDRCGAALGMWSDRGVSVHSAELPLKRPSALARKRPDVHARAQGHQEGQP